ncbi:MAG TPA: hypothetical protein VF817_00065 [Patescibacteria group bacterium]
MELEKSAAKISLMKGRISLRFAIVALLLAAIFFAMLLSVGKTYVTSFEVMVVPKSQIAAAQKEQIVSNLENLPRTVAFYERILKYNPDVRDAVATRSEDQRKQYWDGIVSARKIKADSSIIKLSVKTANQNDSQQLALKVEKELQYTVAMYYDVKNDVDLKVIEEPITTSRHSDWGWLLLASIVLGAAIAGMVESLAAMRAKLVLPVDGIFSKPWWEFKKAEQEDASQKEGSLEDLYNTEQSEAPLDEMAAYSNLEIEQHTENQQEAPQQMQQDPEVLKVQERAFQDMYPNFPEMPARNATQSVAGGPVRDAQKASAPDNLPIADDAFFNAPAESPQAQDEAEKQAASQTHSEPSADELKKRLNQLLKGQL